MWVSIGNLATSNKLDFEKRIWCQYLILHNVTQQLQASKWDFSLVSLLAEKKVVFLLPFPILQDAEHLYLTSIRKSWDKVSSSMLPQ